MQRTANTIINILMGHARSAPTHTAFVWLNNGETATEQWSFAQLLAKVEMLAGPLATKQLQGKRALLVYSNVQDFVRAFLACQYLGIIAVPVFFAANKRYLAKLFNIMEDAQVDTVLTMAGHQKAMEAQFGTYWQQKGISVFCTDDNTVNQQVAVPVDSPGPSGIAFIQYTSGSTGKPKGVVITHQNLLHNQQLIQQTFGCNPQSVILSWLPFHHDMGLIGNILHSIYVGCTCVVMSPMDFIQQPLNWLRAIGQYKVTHSGGPNFAYDHCLNKIPQDALAGLDLTSWQVAFNGAEPVRAESLQRFAAHFGAAGFDAAAFHPCYGLAEATLLVSGCKPSAQPPHIIYIQKGEEADGPLQLVAEPGPTAKPVVSSGQLPSGMQVKIVHANGEACGELEAGEICIHGSSVTQGYWNKDNTGFFYQLADGPYLRTGDAGFMYQGELFVSGRLKEMLIIRGENFYPYDIEHQVAAAVEAIEPNGVAVFGVEVPDEALVVVAELKRTFLQTADKTAILLDIEATLSQVFGIAPHDIVLTTPLGIPRTTSGKLQRLQCRVLYEQSGFSVLGSKKDREGMGGASAIDLKALSQHIKQRADLDPIKTYLVELIAVKTGYRVSDENQDLLGLGIDSIMAVDIMNTINRDLDINLYVSALFENPTAAALATEIAQLLWLKNNRLNEGGEIAI